jgi:hypothetical protein
LRAAKRKIEATFHNFFDVVNLTEIFYAMKVFGKIHLGVSVSVNFPIRGSGVISGLKNLNSFSKFRKFLSKVKS